MKTILLISIPFVVAFIILCVWPCIVAFIILCVWPCLRFGKTKPPLLIRVKDRAIFEPGAVPLREVKWVKNSWLPGGRLVDTGGFWNPNSHREFDVVAREYVIEGLKIMARGDV